MDLDHIAIHVTDMQASGTFYRDVLGLEEIPEPFDDGIHLWFRIGPSLALHVVGDAPSRTAHPISHHVAFRVASLDATTARLDAHAVPYRSSRGDAKFNTRRDGVRQLYLQDPDGYWIEINDAKPN